MSLSRRGFIGAAGAATVVLPLASACGSSPTDANGGAQHKEQSVQKSALAAPRPFTQPLTIPPVIRPTSSDATTDYYDVTTKVASLNILPGLQTQAFTYNGTFPGPTFDVKAGRKIVVKTRNELPVPTVTHLHGGKTPPEHDGYPIDLIMPVNGWNGHVHPGGNVSQGTREYHYPLQQRAATLWYHDHRMDFTGPQVYRGLAGMHILRDDEDNALPLPKGNREIPLIITDRSFKEDGSFNYPSLDPNLNDPPGVTGAFHGGVLGDVTLVNGVPWPYLEVDAVKYRFRILNASNSRHYKLELDPKPNAAQSFIQVGSDGGLLAAPRGHTQIPVAPAERFDVVIDFSKYAVGTMVTLKHVGATGNSGLVMQFRVARTATDDSTVPTKLSTIEPLPWTGGNTPTRQFAFLQGPENGKMVWRINSKSFDPDYIHAEIPRGKVEMWQLVTDAQHPVHVHLSSFQVQARIAEQLAPTDGGWKDTVRLEPNKVVRILVRFDGYPGKYVFHCHNLEHEDMAMMANMKIT
ncbi:MAG TPA: multicopper oxidase domain-containing protein [Actinokineospora sp.]|nr:multicopper oxidase domain-containing protein [Actinokineospora sp.]